MLTDCTTIIGCLWSRTFSRRWRTETIFVCQWLLTEPLCLIMLKWGKYDHIVVTDRAWVETTVFGDNSDKADSLIPIGFDDIHAELKDFLSKQLPIWTNTGEIQPEGMGICEFNGDSFLVLPPNASYGNSTIQAKKSIDYSGGGARENVESKQLSFSLCLRVETLFSKMKLSCGLFSTNHLLWKKYPP